MSDITTGYRGDRLSRRCERCGTSFPALNLTGMPSSAELLGGLMSTAVPLAIEELKRVSFETVQQVARVGAEILAAQGDLLQFKGGKRGETAKVFAATARGLAALSFSPGGVCFLGEHWCAEHPEQKRNR